MSDFANNEKSIDSIGVKNGQNFSNRNNIDDLGDVYGRNLYKANPDASNLDFKNPPGMKHNDGNDLLLLEDTITV